jgi:hypothetical protein
MIWNPKHEDRSSGDGTGPWTPECACGWHLPAVEDRESATAAFRAHLKAVRQLGRTAIH